MLQQGVMLHPARGRQRLPRALGTVSCNHSRAFGENGLPLPQPASSAFSSAMGKWVKQRWALRGTQPTNEISNAASRVRNQTLAGIHAGALLELPGSAASFI